MTVSVLSETKSCTGEIVTVAVAWPSGNVTDPVIAK